MPSACVCASFDRFRYSYNIGHFANRAVPQPLGMLSAENELDLDASDL